MRLWQRLTYVFFLGYISSMSASEGQDIPKMVVKGEASVFKPADQMEVSFGVITEGSDSAAALKENSEHMQQVILNLQAAGLDNTDFETGHFHVEPIYPKNQKGEEGSRKIDHYEVINAVHVKTKKIELAEKIIAAAVKGGANQIERVNFNINNPESFVGEAIQLAAKKALFDATTLASAVGVKLKKIIDISLNVWQQSETGFGENAKYAANYYSAQDRSSSFISAGKTEIHASVNVMWEIDQ